jgi:parallel beta-helix repeat protein
MKLILVIFMFLFVPLIFASSITRSFSKTVVNVGDVIQVNLTVDVGNETFYLFDEAIPTNFNITANPSWVFNHHIKIVEFMNAQDIVYKYNITATSSGNYTFSGAYMFQYDTVEQTVLGQSNIEIKTKVVPISCSPNIEVTSNLILQNSKKNYPCSIYVHNGASLLVNNYTLIVNSISSLGNLIINNSKINTSLIEEQFVTSNISKNPIVKIENSIFANLGEDGIYIKSCSKDSFIRNNKIYNSNDGIHLTTGSGDFAYCALNISYNNITNIDHTSVYIEGSNIGITINNNIIRGIKPTSYGIYAGNTKNLQILNNELYDLHYYAIDIIQNDIDGIIAYNYIHDTKNPIVLNTNIDDFLIKNNTIINAWNYSGCVAIQQYSDRAIIENNIFKNCSNAVWLANDYQPQNVTIAHNSVYDIRYRGFDLQGADGFIIFDNYFYNTPSMWNYTNDAKNFVIYDNYNMDNLSVINNISVKNNSGHNQNTNNGIQTLVNGSIVYIPNQSAKDGIVYVLVAFGAAILIMCAMLVVYMILGGISISTLLMTLGTIIAGVAVLFTLVMILTKLV